MTQQSSVTLDTSDIQGIILRERPTPYVGTYLLIRIDDPADGRCLLQALLPHVTPAARWQHPNDGAWLNLGLTYAGLQPGGLPQVPRRLRARDACRHGGAGRRSVRRGRQRPSELGAAAGRRRRARRPRPLRVHGGSAAECLGRRPWGGAIAPRRRPGVPARRSKPPLSAIEEACGAACGLPLVEPLAADFLGAVADADRAARFVAGLVIRWRHLNVGCAGVLSRHRALTPRLH